MRACLLTLGTLLVLPGAAYGEPSGHPDGGSLAPAAPRAEPPPNPWHEARVGDALEYTYSYARGSFRKPRSQRKLAAALTLETVAIAPPWVWVQVTVKYTDPRWPERTFLIPVDRERQAPPPSKKPPAAGRKREVQVGEVSGTCEEHTVDRSPMDGPRDSWCDTDDARFYLGGRLQASSSSGGPTGRFENSKLQATRVRRGPEGAPAASPPPGLHRLFAPVWYRRMPTSTDADSSGVEVQDVFARGQGLRRWRSLDPVLRTAEDMQRTDLVRVAEAWYAPAEWKETSTGPLLEAVLTLIRAEGREPTDTVPGRRGRVRLASGEVEALVFTDGNFRRTYALNPWAPLFDGLPWPVRVSPLVSEYLSEGRSHGDRLWDWSPTPLQHSAPPEGERPDTLSDKELEDPVKEAAAKSACVSAAARKTGTLTLHPVDVTLKVRTDGRVGAASLRAPPSGKHTPTPKLLRCLEAELRKLRFPPHGRQLPPFELRLLLRL